MPPKPPAHPILPKLQGVFAVFKPEGITSAECLNNLKIKIERELFGVKAGRGRFKIKLGHGGTLDPMATGVLVVGINTGTKLLSQFLSCSKTYVAGARTGSSTDTFDRLGQIVKTAPFDHITEQLVRDSLQPFRGEIQQIPPVYSALRVEGKRMYEYAREGRSLPDGKALEPRQVTVFELELVDYHSGDSTNNFTETPAEDDIIPVKMEALDYSEASTLLDPPVKRKLEEEGQEGVAKKARVDIPVHQTNVWTGEGVSQTVDSEDTKPDLLNGLDIKVKLEMLAEPLPSIDPVPSIDPIPPIDPSPSIDLANLTPRVPAGSLAYKPSPSRPPPLHPSQFPQGPVFGLRIVSSGGFYVRSLINDLGKALNTAAHMISLERVRQGPFELERALREDRGDWKVDKILEQIDWAFSEGGIKRKQKGLVVLGIVPADEVKVEPEDDVKGGGQGVAEGEGEGGEDQGEDGGEE
ncbi:pseudouridine synthase [Gonapodya prolifera JEL478]|uniref:tRNA pseudouridine(55) synthase n=1 Tax=Gonapodya prolifera (strain JEL478) TaxID=1344416 RepID=A0A139AL69_GONPJ|nr:pseudouridine synthase [Gonapodya prolifera JEL478]|eukprot:KXS17541.1 pseudouridine synthase [Gonapodya prolifera JEL478]